MLTIERSRDLDIQRLDVLLRESEAHGFRFLRRMVDDWYCGTNRFERRGEALLLARVEGCLVGLCGLNQDPYAGDDRMGRVRHLYVARECRGRGVGRALVAQVIHEARGEFTLLRLRAVNAVAGGFFERLGFVATPNLAACTHVLDLRGVPGS